MKEYTINSLRWYLDGTHYAELWLRIDGGWPTAVAAGSVEAMRAAKRLMERG